MSSSDIYVGDRWIKEIGNNLDCHQAGIICITPENQTAPWILFEAGAISKRYDESKVIPLLLGMHPGELEGPLSQFQCAMFEKADFKKLIHSINKSLDHNHIPNDVLDATFESFWPKMEQEIRAISEEKIEGTALNISNVTSAFRKYGFPEPSIGNHIYFSSGFESHNVYSTAYTLSNRRLWIWGRKNRKVFDKEHKQFFEKLRERLSAGFDFRVLFLNPNSSHGILSKAHQDPDFESQLSSSIRKAREICQSNDIDFQSITRAYNGLRNTAMVIVDDAILYSPIQYDKDGCVLPLTKAPFNIVGSESDLGQDLEKSFISCWQASESIIG